MLEYALAFLLRSCATIWCSLCFVFLRLLMELAAFSPFCWEFRALKIVSSFKSLCLTHFTMYTPWSIVDYTITPQMLDFKRPFRSPNTLFCCHNNKASPPGKMEHSQSTISILWTSLVSLVSFPPCHKLIVTPLGRTQSPSKRIE